MQIIADGDRSADRFDLGPAIAAAASRTGRPPSLMLLADTSGIARSSLTRWRRRGLTFDQADLLAVRLQLHPGELWPHWWSSATGDQEAS